MAAIGPVKVKLLAQLGDNELVQIGVLVLDAEYELKPTEPSQ